MLHAHLASWPVVAFEAHRTLPRISAVYACGDETGRVLYVGSSVKLRSRWSGHDYAQLLTTMACAWIAWEPCHPRDLQERERQLIALLTPVINSRPPTRPATMPWIACICQQCGMSFEREPAEARKNKTHWDTYCSVACRNASKGERITVICQHCHQPFMLKPSILVHGGGKYCSWACRVARNPGMVTRICLVCGTPFQFKPSALKRSNRSYCSRSCYLSTTKGHRLAE